MIIWRQRKRKQTRGRFTGNLRKIKSLALIAIGVLFLQGGICPTESALAQPPNIILILADDMGWGDLCIQNPDSPACKYKCDYSKNSDCRVDKCPDTEGCIARNPADLADSNTPRLDQMTRAGVRLTNFYAPVPVCAPARAALMTGRHPRHYGMSTAYRPSKTEMEGQVESYSGDLPPNETTMAEILGDLNGDGNLNGKSLNEYHTAVIGKWDMGVGEKSLPWNKGFDEYYIIPEGTGFGMHGFCLAENDPDDVNKTKWHYIETHSNYTKQDLYIEKICRANTTIALSSSNFWDNFRIKDNNKRRSLTEIFAAKAISFIGSAQSPFFLYLPITAPHTPMDIHLPGGSTSDPQDPAKDILNDSTCNSEPDDASVEKCKYKMAYPAVLNELDTQVGKVLEALKDPNNDGDPSDSIHNNTIIIFTSDNGPWLGTGPNHIEDIFDSAGGLSGAKKSTYEGGVRVPFIALWPDGNGEYLRGKDYDGDGKKDGEAHELADLMDLFRTLINAADSTQSITAEDSTDITGVLADSSDPPREPKIIHSWWHSSDSVGSSYDTSGDVTGYREGFPFAVQSMASSSSGYKLYLDYEFIPRALYAISADPTKEDATTIFLPEQCTTYSDGICNTIGNLLGKATEFHKQFQDVSADQNNTVYKVSDSGWVTVSAQDTNASLNIAVYFYDASGNRLLEKNINEIIDKNSTWSREFTINGEVVIHTDKPAHFSQIPYYKYYLPSIKDTTTLPLWENYVTVEAKEKNVPMDVIIKVYDLTGNMVKKRIYSNTSPHADDQVIGGKVVTKPSWIVGSLSTPIAVEGALIIETSVPASVSTNTIAAGGEGFNIHEAPKPRQKHNFPKSNDNLFKAYLLIQNIYDNIINVTITRDKDSTIRSLDIPPHGTLKIRPCELPEIKSTDMAYSKEREILLDGTCDDKYTGPVTVCSNSKGPDAYNIAGDCQGLPVPALNRTEVYTYPINSSPQLEALTIYESPDEQSLLSFPFLRDGMENDGKDYQNWVTIYNPHEKEICATVTLYNNSGGEEGKKTNKLIQKNSSWIWRPCAIKSGNDLLTSCPSFSFSGSAVLEIEEDSSPNKDCYFVGQSTTARGQTNVIYPVSGNTGIDAYNIHEAAIPNDTLFFPKVYDNMPAGKQLVDNWLYISNHEGTEKSISFVLVDKKDATIKGERTETLAPYATFKGRPYNYVNDGSGQFNGSIRVTATYKEGGKPAPITGVMRYEIHQGNLPSSIIDAMTVYRSMGDECPGDDADTPTLWFADTDNDGYGDPRSTKSLFSCSAPVGYVANNSDCNDNNAAIYPGAPEVCDGVDNNCNGSIDENLLNCPSQQASGASVSTCTTCHVDRAAKVSCRNKNWLQHLRKLWVDEATFTLAERTFLGAACRANSGGTTGISKDPSRKTGK